MSAEPIDRLNSDRMPSFALCLESRHSTRSERCRLEVSVP